MSTESGETSKGDKNSEKRDQGSPSGAPTHRIKKKDKGMLTHCLISFIVYFLFLMYWNKVKSIHSTNEGTSYLVPAYP
jgi:hypothetical protein